LQAAGSAGRVHIDIVAAQGRAYVWGQQERSELETPMRRFGRLILALTAAASIPAITTADACIPDGRTVLLMLDSSYSMLRAVSRNGPTRYVVAREAISSVVDRFPRDGYLALRLYGSQATIIREDCRDTFLAVPFAVASKNSAIIKLTLANSHAHGVTPLALAMEQAVSDFGDTKEERRIVIVTDGGETCGGNPCATAARMAMDGYVIDTVGFLINDLTARTQLQCIAKVTGGTYVDVRAYLELGDHLTKLIGECAVVTLPPWRNREDVAVAEAIS
jgi:Ca-activated chloride channel family protein